MSPHFNVGVSDDANTDADAGVDADDNDDDKDDDDDNNDDSDDDDKDDDDDNNDDSEDDDDDDDNNDDDSSTPNHLWCIVHAHHLSIFAGSLLSATLVDLIRLCAHSLFFSVSS